MLTPRNRVASVAATLAVLVSTVIVANLALLLGPALREVLTADLAITLLLVAAILVISYAPAMLNARQAPRPAPTTLPPSQHPLFDRQLDQFPR